MDFNMRTFVHIGVDNPTLTWYYMVNGSSGLLTREYANRKSYGGARYMNDKSNLSTTKFKEYCENCGFSRYIFDSNMHDGLHTPRSCKSMLTFENLVVPDGFSTLYLYNENVDNDVKYHQNFVRLSHVRSISVVDENIVYTVFEITCSNTNAENKYYLAAR